MIKKYTSKFLNHSYNFFVVLQFASILILGFLSHNPLILHACAFVGIALLQFDRENIIYKTGLYIGIIVGPIPTMLWWLHSWSNSFLHMIKTIKPNDIDFAHEPLLLTIGKTLLTPFFLNLLIQVVFFVIIWLLSVVFIMPFALYNHEKKFDFHQLNNSEIPHKRPMKLFAIFIGVVLILFCKGNTLSALGTILGLFGITLLRLLGSSKDKEDDIRASSNNNFAELRELKSLLDDGIITQEDFDKKKADILG